MTHCLIIAGPATDRNHLAVLLNSYGFEIQSAQSPEEALALCRNRMPDVIMMPDTMGTMNSVAFLQRLRRARLGSKPVVLICAEQTSASSISQAIWEGASECLIEPFDADILDFKLRQVGVAGRDEAA
ncbi:two-component system chemotaxis response regulator CheY [Rhodoligotrophos appendicifer]|uniref:response regulator n=1 Tax=Rhodoligotrophos appendicifer TaxID=987056 RepID=UPI00118537B8|nr:response regulator [Rhodoligotrophos appendicifer]